MDLVTEWIRQIAAYLIFSSVVSNLIHKQNYIKYIRLVMGVILIFMLTQPIRKLAGQEEIYQFRLSNYLLTEEAQDSSFINNVEEEKEQVLFRELKAAVGERIRQIALIYGFEITEINLQFSTNTDTYGVLEQLDLIIQSKEPSEITYELESPDVIRMHNELSNQLGLKREKISITLY